VVKGPLTGAQVRRVGLDSGGGQFKNQIDTTSKFAANKNLDPMPRFPTYNFE